MSGMDFFGHQERARKSSRNLVFLFVLAVLAIIASIHFAATALLLATDVGSDGPANWQVLVAVTAVTLFVIVLGVNGRPAPSRPPGNGVAWRHEWCPSPC